MKIIPLNQLLSLDIAFTDISVTYRSPQWNTLGNLTDHRRSVNGFLLIDRGMCHYDWIGGNTDLSHGGLIYLPLGSKKIISVTEKPFSYYNINFNIADIRDGKQILFDKDPLVISHSASQRIFDSCNIMLNSTMSRNGLFKSTGMLCEIFNIIISHYTNRSTSRIAAAIEFIENNYTKDIDISQLANMCYMSQAHFFRLFKAETSLSPIEYKNKLRLERAKALMSENECSVSEAADILGFESVYYFSRFFKKNTGIPPSEYSTFR